MRKSEGVFVPPPVPVSKYFAYREFPFRRPDEMNGSGVVHPVVIVGAGPVGLSLAIYLRRSGVNCVVLENDRTVCGGSRAAAASRRSLEFLDQIGAADAFLRDALVWSQGVTYWQRDREVYRFAIEHPAHEKFPPFANLPQPNIEAELVQVAEEAGVEIRWQSEVRLVDQDRDSVTLAVATPDGTYDLRAEFAVACDGARSPVRGMLGLRLQGESFEGTYLVIDILQADRGGPGRRAWVDPPAACGRAILMHRFPLGILRIDCLLGPEEDLEAELAPDRVRARVQAVLDLCGERSPWELEWVSTYSARTLMLDDFRHGRVFFAGDAAHIVPIYGARGMNSGLMDVSNLGWKLAAVLRGQAPNTLLDTYSPERRPAIAAIFRDGGTMARFMTPQTDGYRIMRTAALSLAASERWAGQIAAYRHSPFVYADTPLQTDWPSAGPVTGGPPPGAPVPAFRLGGDQGFLTDHLGLDPCLIVFSRSGPPDWVASLVNREARGGRRLQVLVVGRDGIDDSTGQLAQAFGAREGSVYLLRPDWHVAARGHGPEPSDVTRAVARLWGNSNA